MPTMKRIIQPFSHVSNLYGAVAELLLPSSPESCSSDLCWSNRAEISTRSNVSNHSCPPPKDSDGSNPRPLLDGKSSPFVFTL